SPSVLPYRHRAACPRPSIPTRRSSDLSPRQHGEPPPSHVASRARHAPHFDELVHVFAQHPVPVVHAVPSAAHDAPPSIGAASARSEEHTSDSSHQIFSYAVFCLKKNIH